MKPLAYILVFVFSFISIGTSLFYFSEMAHIRTIMKVRAREDEKQLCLTFTKEVYEKLDWEEKDAEFLLQGKMYDVSSVEIDGDHILVYCVFDKKETMLRRKLKEIFSNSPDKNLPLRHLVKVLSQQYYLFSVSSMSGLNHSSLVSHLPYILTAHSDLQSECSESQDFKSFNTQSRDYKSRQALVRSKDQWKS